MTTHDVGLVLVESIVLLQRDMRFNLLLTCIILVSSIFHSSWGLGHNTPECSRRQALFLVGGCGGWATAIMPVPDATAATTKAKGAAELDWEFYVRDLLGGNAKEGTIQRSAAPPMPPPRTLQEPLLSLLLNNDCTPSCVPCQALLELLGSSSNTSSTIISKQSLALRDKAAPSFAARAQYQTEQVRDQYFFDLTSYCLWRVVANLLPDFTTRDVFARNIGRKLYQQVKEHRLILVDTISDPPTTLADVAPVMLEVLNLFQRSNFCSSYRITGNDGTTLASSGSNTAKTGIVVFDDLDNKDLQNGATVNLLVSVLEPATLGASLQITGEQSRFAPEFVGTTLAAVLEDAGIKASYETYFVDQTYRPNPKDYFPDEQLLQFSLTKAY